MVKVTNQKLKDLSVLMSQVYSRKHGREVKVTLERKKQPESA